MDIVERLNRAIQKLPTGEHSIGLSAIIRHINASIRHFENGADIDQDCFTDAVYRTNQAYEGSLKEAYRVLANKDPSGLTPHIIENYLEENQIVRPRVLIQLSRYRQDYRNPSTHDYKLDFNEDEALLAIVSVCAFAKLLVGQISEKLAYDNVENNTQRVSPPNTNDPSNLSVFIGNSIANFLDKEGNILEPYALRGAISAVVSNSGFQTLSDVKMHEEEQLDWDIIAKKGDMYIPIEIRRTGQKAQKKDFYCILTIDEAATEQKMPVAIAVLKSKSTSKYNLFKTKYKNTEIYFVSNYSLHELNNGNENGHIFEAVRV